MWDKMKNTDDYKSVPTWVIRLLWLPQLGKRSLNRLRWPNKLPFCWPWLCQCQRNAYIVRLWLISSSPSIAHLLPISHTTWTVYHSPIKLIFPALYNDDSPLRWQFDFFLKIHIIFIHFSVFNRVTYTIK